MKEFCLLIICAALSVVSSAQFTEEAVAITTNIDSLRGEFIVPDNAASFPLVIIVAGSGPTDRNGNSPIGVSANSYKMLATELAKHKIGSLLFDKRGIGASKAAMVTENELRFDTYVQDLIGWIEKAGRDKRVKNIIIAGHSEGSLIGMLAAQKTRVNGYISIEGPASGIDKIIMTQLSTQPEKIRAEVDSIFSLLKQDKRPDSVPPYLMSLFRPAIQGYMQSWIKYNPCEEIKKLTIPVLVVQGTSDIQVNETEGKSLAACNPAAGFALISGMNHVLKNSSPDRNENIATYSNALLPVNEKLITVIASFVASIHK